ncbi:MAG: electron transfer flavoprotein subunit beta/FixA family protein [Candidatus Omnitrophica bacterium]|nr:electron transfer flavoprotein subunit beta/FixA family protein [Candidatus Omnitrophota bacterium]MDD3988150.1 electron transfer flavoprotein subunit beta/FixA family protein [Candidatus Omnitrophota bacterium]MDD5665606.1 electron transfer flavoprotein subunit beta/FixA family protein [Candidatus Omnitrophota bacterium]
MNIIVCIKQVPETTEVRINPETNTLMREGVKAIINPFDMYAIEEGVRLKERFGGKVSVITMGPPQADAALREAISMGADEGFLVCDRAFAGSDTWATSYTLAGAVKKVGAFDIIICGKQASDGDTAQVGPGISTHLNIPQVTYVKKVEEATDKMMRLERMLEEGYEVIETPLPVLLTVVKEINEPRIPSLKGLMRAKSAKITMLTQKELDLDPQQIGLCGSPTQVVKIFTPPQRQGGQVLKGEIPDIASQLVELLRSEVN